MIRRRRASAPKRALRAAIALAVVTPLASAGAAPVTPIAEATLRHLAEAVDLPGDGSVDWRIEAGRGVMAALCAAEEGRVARLALATRSTAAEEDRRCAAGGLPTPVAFAIGREAVFLVARRSGDGFGLRSRDLYLALAAEVPLPDGRRVPNRASRWRDVDPRLPDSPIRVRVPAPGSPLAELFAQTVLEAGCLSFAANRAIFDARERLEACTTLRADAAVVGPSGTIDAWLALQPAHAVAIAGQPDIHRLDDALTVLALDGVVPTYTAVTSDVYPAARIVQLVVVAAPADRPGDAEPLLDAARTLGSESSIGPYGSLAAAGLTPLPAVERVELRERLRTLGGS